MFLLHSIAHAHGHAVVDGALRSDSEVYIGGPLTVEFDIEGNATGPYQVYLEGDNEEVRVICSWLFVVCVDKNRCS